MSATTRRWFECRHLVTFGDTNTAGSVYFAKYIAWQGECRERLLAQFYPEFAQDLKHGFGMTTEFVHQEFFSEATLFNQLLIKLTVTALTRSRIEFEFEFLREQDSQLLGRGRQAVIWTNAQHRPSLMPDQLYDATASYFDLVRS
jgi:enediyne core biosynthesis thioesterase